MLGLDPLALERGQRAEAEVEDRLCLDLGELEALHQTGARRVGVLGRADQRDHRVEVVERDQVALEDVRTLLGLPELELRAADDDRALELEVVAQELEQRQRLRHAVDERDRVVAERRLERGVLEELVEDDLRDRLALQLDDDAHARLVGRVAEPRDLGEHPALDELGHLGDHALVAALLDAVRELADHDRATAAALLLGVRAGTHDDAAAARAVRLLDPVAAEDDRAGREVGALDVLGQLLDVDGRVVDQRDQGVGHLAEVVRRDVRRHADRDPGRAVDEQVREARRQHLRLLARLVVVRPEVDRVGVDVAEELGRHLREPALGVPLGGGGVAVDVPEVALAVDERVAQRERLRHADERVVDRGVAVRVVVAHHLADDAGALHARPVRLEPELGHRVEDPAVDGLEAVAHVGQRARDDRRHRVVEEARAHLCLELARLDAAGAERFDDVRHGAALYIQELHVLGVLLDEEPARLDLVAHQRREDEVGGRRRPRCRRGRAAAWSGPSSSPPAPRRPSRRGP